MLAIPFDGISIMDEESSKQFVAERGLHKTDPEMVRKFKKAQKMMKMGKWPSG